MPIIKSAAKRMRQTTKRTKLNSSYRRKVHDRAKEFQGHVQAGEADKAKASLNQAVSAIDKAVKRGLLHKNTAARRKSRLNRLYDQTFAKGKKPAAKTTAKSSPKKKSTGTKSSAKKAPTKSTKASKATGSQSKKSSSTKKK